MKKLQDIIIEKLKLNKDSQSKKHLNIDDFAYKYKFINSHQYRSNMIIYTMNDHDLYKQYYNKFQQVLKDILYNPEKYEKSINLDTKKYCLSCLMNNDDIRLKIKEVKNKELNASLITIVMFDDTDNELLYKYSLKKLNESDKIYLEYKITDLLEQIFNI